MGFMTARKRSGLTQRKVAELLEIDQSSVCLWETGKTRPRAALLPKLARLYGCTVDELLEEDASEAEMRKETT